MPRRAKRRRIPIGRRAAISSCAGHVQHMLVCLSHANNDPIAPRPGRPPSQAEGASSLGRNVAVRLPSSRDPRHCGTPDDRRAPRSAHTSCRGAPDAFAREGCSRGERRALIVVDASALIEVLLGTSAASRLAERFFAEGETLHAPHLIDLEVGQVLRRYARSGVFDAGRGAEALEDLADFPIARYPHTPFLSRIWELRHNVTAYDAAYLALSEALAAPLVTRDAKLASVAGHQAQIELM